MKLPKATHDGIIDVNGFKIECYNLDNGNRVLSRIGFLRALGRTGKAKGGRRYDNEFQTPVFLTAKNLKNFISTELEENSKPVLFTDLNGNEAIGYKAELLPAVCYVFIDALDVDALRPNQIHIADQAKIIIRAFATVGIISLIDEATGFQYQRDKGILQEFLSKFIREQRGIYIKTYPDDFFEAVFKMRHLTWSLAAKGKKPQYFGHLINNYVYSRIAPGVLTELRRVNPKDEVTGKRKGKFTEFIDDVFGHPKLKEHLMILTALAKAAGYNWTNWDRLVNRALPKFEADGSQIQELDMPE